jgi:hypothetical protein
MERKPRAFVLIPFDETFDDVYDGVIVPPLEDAGYEVVRADSRLDQQQILKGVVEGIASADLVVAELTGLNPNVFYELGIAHGLRVPTVVITQSMESVPFDLRPYRVEQYSPQFRDVDRLRERLREIASLRQKAGVAFGSPVTDFLPGPFGTGGAPVQPTPPGLDTGEADGDEMGWLNFAEELEANLEAMNTVLGRIAEDTANLGGKLEAHTEAFVAMRERPVQPSAREMREASSAVAADMEESGRNLASWAPQLDGAIGAVSGSMEGLLRTASPPSSPEERQQLAELREAPHGLLDVTTEALGHVREYRRVIAGLKGISSDVTRASRRLTDGLDRVIAGMERVQAFCSRMMLLLDEKLQEMEALPATGGAP